MMPIIAHRIIVSDRVGTVLWSQASRRCAVIQANVRPLVRFAGVTAHPGM